MPREVAEWTGRNDDAMPGKLVRDRLSLRQGDCCAECRQPFGPKRRAHCDHIIPLSDGGENRESNLQMLCTDCHARKTSAEATACTMIEMYGVFHLGWIFPKAAGK